MPLAPVFPLISSAQPVNPPPPVIIPNVYPSASNLSSVQSSSSKLPLPYSEIKKWSKYTSEQYNKSEKKFNENWTIEQPEKAKFATKIGLTSAQVANWFAKRRIQLRKRMTPY